MNVLVKFTFTFLIWSLSVSSAQSAEPPGKFATLGRDIACEKAAAVPPGLCHKKVIYIGPSASGLVLNLLDENFELVVLDDEAAPQELGPVLVGAAELKKANFVVLLQDVYEAGHTVGVVEAFPKEVQRLHQALGFSSGCAQNDNTQTPLVTVQKTLDRRPNHRATSVLLPRLEVDNSSKRKLREADRRAREWLIARFSDAPPVPVTDPGSCSDPENCLTQLASSTACNFLAQNSAGDSVELNNNIWSTRSFMNSLDFYYVEQEFQGFLHNGAQACAWGNGVNNTFTSPNIVPITTQPSPGSTSCSTSTTSGVSFMVGGNAGFNTLQGFNVTPVNVGMDIANSTTINCPTLNIIYQGDPSKGTVNWSYEQPLSSPGTYNNETLVVTNHWIWEVGFNEYSGSQTNIQFTSDALEDYINVAPCTNFVELPLNVTSTAPLPFDTFTITAPSVGSVLPTSVERGQKFNIQGMGLYPSLVTDVQLGGVSLPSGNFTPVSDTSLTVVVPDTTSIGNNSVGVQTTQGQSNTNVVVDVTP